MKFSTLAVMAALYGSTAAFHMPPQHAKVCTTRNSPEQASTVLHSIQSLGNGSSSGDGGFERSSSSSSSFLGGTPVDGSAGNMLTMSAPNMSATSAGRRGTRLYTAMDAAQGLHKMQAMNDVRPNQGSMTMSLNGSTSSSSSSGKNLKFFTRPPKQGSSTSLRSSSFFETDGNDFNSRNNDRMNGGSGGFDNGMGSMNGGGFDNNNNRSSNSYYNNDRRMGGLSEMQDQQTLRQRRQQDAQHGDITNGYGGSGYSQGIGGSATIPVAPDDLGGGLGSTSSSSAMRRPKNVEYYNPSSNRSYENGGGVAAGYGATGGNLSMQSRLNRKNDPFDGTSNRSMMNGGMSQQRSNPNDRQFFSDTSMKPDGFLGTRGSPAGSSNASRSNQSLLMDASRQRIGSVSRDPYGSGFNDYSDLRTTSRSPFRPDQQNMPRLNQMGGNSGNESSMFPATRRYRNNDAPDMMLDQGNGLLPEDLMTDGSREATRNGFIADRRGGGNGRNAFSDFQRQRGDSYMDDELNARNGFGSERMGGSNRRSPSFGNDRDLNRFDNDDFDRRDEFS